MNAKGFYVLLNKEIDRTISHSPLGVQVIFESCKRKHGAKYVSQTTLILKLHQIKLVLLFIIIPIMMMI